jgi:hypothetical protein
MQLLEQEPAITAAAIAGRLGIDANTAQRASTETTPRPYKDSSRSSPDSPPRTSTASSATRCGPHNAP